jgi:N-acetyl-anhydromuramyl-L-alanine amidase AmpD
MGWPMGATTLARLAPKVVVEKRSPNYSSRLASISLIVLHSTESHNVPNSASDLAGVASWFANPASQVSAHVIVDADGHSARCVSDKHKAWHCMGYNSPALGIEQVGHASQPNWERPEWVEAARWIAQWSHEHHVPIRRARVFLGRVIRSGVTTHKKLGVYGGNHEDPGVRYPLRRVLKMARKIKRERYG